MSWRWHTHVGDDWFLDTPHFQAEGSLNPAYPRRFNIDSVTPKAGAGALTAGMLHDVLWCTRQQFAEDQVLLELVRETQPLVELLADRGLVKWELVTQPYSRQARLVEVLPPGKPT